MARRADVMTLRDAASLSRRAVVYRTRFAENKVLGDLDGHDVRAQDVELDGQKEFFENSCYSVSSGLLSHRLKKYKKTKYRLFILQFLIHESNAIWRIRILIDEKIILNRMSCVSNANLVGNDFQSLRRKLEVNILHSPKRLVMPDR